MLLDLLRSFRRRGRPSAAHEAAPVDPWGSVERSSGPDPELLLQIEQAALDVYAAHGLPTRPGHYRRSQRAQTWTFLGEHLTPEARWALMLERPPEAGWRYATLPDLGRTGVPDVVAAAALLDGCARLGQAASGPGGPQRWAEIERAIRLGAQWQALQGRPAKATEPRLRLTAPDSALRADGSPKPLRRKPPRPA